MDSCNSILMILVIMRLGWLSVIALFSSYFFMSVMFPTIFAIGLKGLGPLTKRAASFLVMAVAGGAFCPPLMGAIADHFGMPLLLLFLFFVLLLSAGMPYGVIKNHRQRQEILSQQFIIKFFSCRRMLLYRNGFWNRLSQIYYRECTKR